MNMRSDFTHGHAQGSRSTSSASGAPRTERSSYPSNRISNPSTVDRSGIRGTFGDGRGGTIETLPSPPSEIPGAEDKNLYQSSYDTEGNIWNRMAGAWMLGFAATAGLFMALPFFQLISTVGDQLSDVTSINLSKPPPPPPPAETKPPPEKEEKKDEPELKQEQPKLTLSQLALALNPGMGDATGGGDFAINFQVSAMEELAVIFELSEVDRVPQPIYRVAPLYPYEMKQAGVSGSVSLIFVCDTEGRVRRVQTKTSSHNEFEEPAIRAIREWRFEPGIKDGQPVNVRMLIPFKFNLNER